MTQQNEIIKEVRAIRESYAERFGFDIRAIWQDAKEHEGDGARAVVILEPKRLSFVVEREEVEASEPA